MEINKINNLLELFYKQYLTQDKTSVFLQSLKEVEKKYSWEDIHKEAIWQQGLTQCIRQME